MADPFRFAFLEENDRRAAMSAVIPDFTHERLALFADEHTAVGDMIGVRVDLPVAIWAFNVYHLQPPPHDTPGSIRNLLGRNLNHYR